MTLYCLLLTLLPVQALLFLGARRETRRQQLYARLLLESLARRRR